MFWFTLVPFTVNEWIASPSFVTVIVAPSLTPAHAGSNAKSFIWIEVAGVTESHAGSPPEPEHATAPTASIESTNASTRFRIPPEPTERPLPPTSSGPSAARRAVGYDAGTAMDQALSIPPQPLVHPVDAPRLVARAAAVDAVGLEARAAALATRSIKKAAKLQALDLAIRCMDLTTLEGADTVGKIVAMCAKAVRPDPTDPSVPSVAAVCVYPWLVPTAVAHLGGTSVKVASVAGAFPGGLGPFDARLQEIRDVVAMGAHEVDIVLNRSLFLGGRYAQAYEELLAAREAASGVRLKVILEVGELGSYDRIRQASVLAMAAGADFIKTSTGKIGVSATLPNALCMMEAARDFHRDAGRVVGIKVAGGVRKSKQAIQYLVLVHETLGAAWLTPDLFRIGASSLLNDVLMQLGKERTGRYQSPDYFTVD